ncbi:phage tail protein [Paenibacillus polymyxa]|uniref:pyocin knob domain-containing protein n=1 Tax=Paenibacillus polymyxa TaxID=1406 RepID=UPI0010BED637|nr:phage tail protein [Paenibacillus polymyxa]
MEKMYPPVVNSPKTELAELITDTQTEITVANASVLLQGEGIAVLGNGDVAETITYTSVEENVLKGCIRGFEGVARAWPVGTRVARNFTAYDHVAFKGNIEELGEGVADAAAVAAAAIPAVQKGAASGVATLDKDSKVPTAQLPISTATNNTSSTQVAAASAVKAAYDLANSAYRYRGNVPTNWNDATLSGNYNVALSAWTGFSNYPPGAYTYGKLVVNYDSGAIVQMYFSHDNPGRIYTRISFAGLDWREWTEIFMTRGGSVWGTIDSKNAIPLAIYRPGYKSWALHKSDNGRVYISPSNTIDGTDWNFGNGLWIEEGNIGWQGGDLNSLKASSANLFSGNGSPEGAVSAPVGSLYRRLDGYAGETLYIKESGTGNTGWRAVK